MTDTSVAMVTTPAESRSINTILLSRHGPRCMHYPWINLICLLTTRSNLFCLCKGSSLRQPAVFKIHRELSTYSYHGELIRPIETKTGWMGTIIIRPAEGGSTNIIVPDGTPLNSRDDPPVTQPMVITTSSKIKIAKPPRFTGDKKWEGFILAVDTYLMAYHEEFKSDEQKIWFVISYLGTVHNASFRTGSEIGKKKTILHTDDYGQFLKDLWTAFEDPNLKVDATKDLWQLRQGKDTLMEYFTKFELKAAMARYCHLNNILIDLLKSQVWYEIQTELYRGGIPLLTDYNKMKQRLHNIEISLEEEKLRRDAFHVGAPIPPRRAPYVPPQQNTNYIPSSLTPTMAQTYGGQGQPMDLSRTWNQVTCHHCGKLGYHIYRNCKGDCQHCHWGWRVHFFRSLPETTAPRTAKAGTFLIVMDLITIMRSSCQSRNRNIETTGTQSKTMRGEQKSCSTITKYSHQQSLRLARRSSWTQMICV